MKTRNLAAWLAVAQGSFYFGVGLWSLLHPASFVAATGAPVLNTKQELWLAQTVEVLLVVIGLTLIFGGWRRRHSTEILLLGFAVSVAIAAVDFLSYAQGLVERAYLLSGILQFTLAILWIFAWRTSARTETE